jgi:deoxyribose-phosphate aldolase
MAEDTIARRIDHTCLRPDATSADIERLCDEALRHAFHAVCVAPRHVVLAVSRVAGSGVVVCSVAGFPHGDTVTVAKVAEARDAIERGAIEVDMVMAVGALKEGNDAEVAGDIARVAAAVHGRPGALVKVILETALLSGEEIERACRIAESAGADFVKTSTGFAAGATVDAVRLMRRTVGDRLGVKAAGGIRDAAAARAMLDAGASRLGTSASVAIVTARDRD